MFCNVRNSVAPGSAIWPAGRSGAFQAVLPGVLGVLCACQAVLLDLLGAFLGRPVCSLDGLWTFLGRSGVHLRGSEVPGASAGPM